MAQAGAAAGRFYYNAAMEPMNDRRTDPKMRTIFVRAYEILDPYMNSDGSFLTLAHEHQAMEVMRKEFPDLDGTRMFALLGYIRSVRSSGRKPVP